MFKFQTNNFSGNLIKTPHKFFGNELIFNVRKYYINRLLQTNANQLFLKEDTEDLLIEFYGAKKN